MAMTIQDVEFPANGHTVPGYLAIPEGDGPFPGIVVIQEWWGLDDHIKEIGRRFAGEGYVAIVPDLYYGKIATEPTDAMKLAMDMDGERAIRDIVGALEFLDKRSDTGKLAMIGYCMGGRIVWQTALASELASAGIAYYGRPPEPYSALAEQKTPLFGVFAGHDRIPASVADELNDAWKEAGRTDCNAIVYPEAHHGFFNETRPGTYDTAAAEDVWAKTKAFLKQHTAT